MEQLAKHLENEHDTPAELLNRISKIGMEVLHEGAHTEGPKNKPRPDGATVNHIRTGEGE